MQLGKQQRTFIRTSVKKLPNAESNKDLRKSQPLANRPHLQCKTLLKECEVCGITKDNLNMKASQAQPVSSLYNKNANTKFQAL
jgi:hypothetical protein